MMLAISGSTSSRGPSYWKSLASAQARTRGGGLATPPGCRQQAPATDKHACVPARAQLPPISCRASWPPAPSLPYCTCGGGSGQGGLAGSHHPRPVQVQHLPAGSRLEGGSVTPHHRGAAQLGGGAPGELHPQQLHGPNGAVQLGSVGRGRRSAVGARQRSETGSPSFCEVAARGPRRLPSKSKCAALSHLSPIATDRPGWSGTWCR